MAEEQPPVDASQVPNPAPAEPAQTEPQAPPAESAQATPTAALDPAESALPDQAAIDDILKDAAFEDVSQAVGQEAEEPAAETAMATATATAVAPSATATAMPPAEEFPLPNLQQVMQDAQVSSIDLLRDVDLNVKIELGRTRMLVEDVLKLGEGSVVELDKLAGDPVDVFVNERLVARGEVLVLNDNFCVRINEIVAGIRDDDL